MKRTVSLPGVLYALLGPALPVLLSLLGLVFLVVAAFTVGVTIGYAVLGLSFLLLAFYSENVRRP